jgi:hypothetical protein
MSMRGARTNLPDFLIIGAAKSGTTSLYRYLASHPEIYMSPEKEPRYFGYPDTRPECRGPFAEHHNRRIVWQLDGYRRLFAARRDEKAAGEASSMYLHAPQCAAAIQKVIPDVRMLAILRQPVDRAYSHFCDMRRLGREPCRDFGAALAAEEERHRRRWVFFNYRNAGLYGAQLERFYALFPKEQLLVFLHDDLAANPYSVLGKICRFLGVDDRFPFDTSERHNVTQRMPRSDIVNRMLNRENMAKSAVRLLVPRALRSHVFATLYGWNSVPKPPYPQDIRRQLRDFYREDILKLEKLIDRDLSAWLEE